MSTHQHNATKLLSTQLLVDNRKGSIDIGRKKTEQDVSRVFNIPELDVSVIENNPTHAVNKANINDPLLSPLLRKIHSASPISHLPQTNANQSKVPAKKPTPQQEQDDDELSRPSNIVWESINWRAVWLYLKLILFSYEFNMQEYLRDIDEQITEQVIDLLKIAPGYKSIQHVYIFYTLKYNIVVGTMAAIIYPLPYSLLFLFITIDLTLPFVAVFVLAGVRSGAMALLLKYCLHFPKHTFHWIVLIFTALIGVFLPNNYIYLLLFGISIFLSFYLKDLNTGVSQNSQDEPQLSREESNFLISGFGFDFNEEQIYKEYKVYDKLPQTYPDLSIGILIISFLVMWVLHKSLDGREISIFAQILPVSLLTSSKEMLAFFPYLYQQTVGESTVSPNTLISLSFLFPGPHSKAFMFFIDHKKVIDVLIGYVCLFLPSILLANIFIGYRPHFFSRTYYNIRQSIQAVGNGIVFCLVFWMLSNQPCFFNSICYSAVVIMVVAKLYKLRQLFAITLGIFLISTRTIILHVNKNVPLDVQACVDNQFTKAWMKI